MPCAAALRVARGAFFRQAKLNVAGRSSGLAALLALSAGIVVFVLPASRLHCQPAGRALSLAMIVVLGAFAPRPFNVPLALVWMLGTIPCLLTPVVAIDGPPAAAATATAEHFASSVPKRRGKKSKRRKSKEEAAPLAPPLPPLPGQTNPLSAALLDKMGMQTISQKREAFRNQLTNIDHQIKGLGTYFKDLDEHGLMKKYAAKK